MRVIIAGSRGIENPWTVEQAIRHSGFQITEVVSGGAKGVDRIGESWAAFTNVPCTQFIPDWKKLGKSAGFIRNLAMAEYADALIAVWDGESPGTKHMIEIMQKKDKPIYIW